MEEVPRKQVQPSRWRAKKESKDLWVNDHIGVRSGVHKQKAKGDFIVTFECY